MNLLFDFTVNKEAKTINITREFAAGPSLVWDAFTKAEILDQWYAPKPFRLSTKEMNFTVGGRWLYAMISPDDARRWGATEFININPITSFATKNTFTDENGISLSNMFSITTNTFKGEGERTTVFIEKVFDDLAVLEMMATNGFKEGTEANMKNLDEYFETIAANK